MSFVGMTVQYYNTDYSILVQFPNLWDLNPLDNIMNSNPTNTSFKVFEPTHETAYQPTRCCQFALNM